MTVPYPEVVTHNIPLWDHWTRVCFDVEYAVQKRKSLSWWHRTVKALDFARAYGLQSTFYCDPLSWEGVTRKA